MKTEIFGKTQRHIYARVHLPNFPQDLTPLYENLGKTITPRSASLVLMDIVGAGNIDFKFAEAEYDDYEEFNYNEGYYPGKQNFSCVLKHRPF